jgi:hypothetical protein
MEKLEFVTRAERPNRPLSETSEITPTHSLLSACFELVNGTLSSNLAHVPVHDCNFDLFATENGPAVPA